MQLSQEDIIKFTNNVKQVLVLRKDLNMRKGKCVSQGSHSSVGAVLSEGYIDEREENYIIPLKSNGELTPLGFWLSTNFKKICVYVNSEQELLDLYEKTKALNIPCSLIQDSGLTEFNGIPTYTALGIGPAMNESFIGLTDKLPLF